MKPNSGSASIRARIEHRKFQATEGDLITLLNAYEAFEENGKSRDWCMKYFLNYKGLLRVAEIQNQVTKLLGKDFRFESAAG